jgi:hypothetical protein
MSLITDPVELLNAALERIEARVSAVASICRLNAMLALADPAWVLPRPALARLAMGPSATQVLRPGHRFRCSESMSGEDILFTSVLPDVELHPWAVKEAQWIATDSGPSAPARGLRIDIERQEGFRGGPGWLSMHGGRASGSDPLVDESTDVGRGPASARASDSAAHRRIDRAGRDRGPSGRKKRQ